MKKRLLIGILLPVFPSNAVYQTSSFQPIHNRKNILPVLYFPVRINCLKAEGESYFNIQTATKKKYSRQSFKKAEAIKSTTVIIHAYFNSRGIKWIPERFFSGLKKYIFRTVTSINEVCNFIHLATTFFSAELNLSTEQDRIARSGEPRVTTTMRAARVAELPVKNYVCVI